MVRLTLRDARGAVVGRKVVPLFHGGAIKLSVRLTPRALRLLRRAGPRRLTVTHEFRDVVAGSARGTTAVALR
jgi:hypothetical protein